MEAPQGAGISLAVLREEGVLGSQVIDISSEFVAGCRGSPRQSRDLVLCESRGKLL